MNMTVLCKVFSFKIKIYSNIENLNFFLPIIRKLVKFTLEKKIPKNSQFYWSKKDYIYWKKPTGVRVNLMVNLEIET